MMSTWQKPFISLHRGGLTKSFHVVKEAEGYRRGEKILDPELAQRIMEEGGRLRPIRCPRSSLVHNALKAMAQAIDLHHEAQFGFIKDRNCVEGAFLHRKAKSVLTIDILDAFEQVTEREVRYILKHILDVNRIMATMIADLTCYQGRLYQGSPLAPALFNIRSLHAAERLTRLAAANGLICTIYADDITISSDKWSYFTRSFIKTVIRILAEEGLRVNKDKIHVTHQDPRTVGLTDITGLTIDYDDNGQPFVRPIHRGKYTKKAAYLKYLYDTYGIEYSRECARDGTDKALVSVYQGLQNWSEVEKHGAQTFLFA